MPLYLATYCFIITATGDIKPSSSSGDHMIADSIVEGNPDQPTFKSEHVNHYSYVPVLC